MVKMVKMVKVQHPVKLCHLESNLHNLHLHNLPKEHQHLNKVIKVNQIKMAKKATEMMVDHRRMIDGMKVIITRQGLEESNP